MSKAIRYREIDFYIRELIRVMNKLGFKTYGSCEGHGGMGWISFRPPYDWDKPDWREELKDLIERYGYKVSEIRRGIEGGHKALWYVVEFI